MSMLAKNICGLVVSFVVTGGRSLSFQTLNLEVFKTEQEKLFVLISIILCADSVATYASIDQILLRICEWSKIYNFIKKVFKTKLKNLLSYVSI